MSGSDTEARRPRGPGQCLVCGKELPRSGSSWYATHCRAHTNPSSRFRPGDARAIAAGKVAGARVREAFEALRRQSGGLPVNRLTDDGETD